MATLADIRAARVFADHLAAVAIGHTRLAETSDTETERAHWEFEAHRFRDLAEMALISPEEARAAYRPTRAFQPTA